MPAAEPHPRRRRALRRALATALASGVLVLGGSASPIGAGQILPTTTTEPPVTTEPEPVETTTTTEVQPAPTTTQQTATTRATPTTVEDSFDVGDGPDDVVDGDELDGDDDAVEDDATEEVPAETTSTGRDLLVAGDGSEGARSTTTTSTTLVEVAADDATLDEETQIWLIVAGLVVVAALIGAWTWRYWVRTKPSAAPKDGEDPTTVFRRR